jgi:hypothetical protein
LLAATAAENRGKSPHCGFHHRRHADSRPFTEGISSLHAGIVAREYTETYNRRMALFSEGQRAVMVRVLQHYLARGWADQEEVAGIFAALLL